MRGVLIGVVAFALVCGASMALTIHEIPVWPPVLMAILVMVLLDRLTALSQTVVFAALAYAGGFLSAWIRSFTPNETSMRLAWVLPTAVLASAAVSLAGLAGMLLNPKEREASARYLLPFLMGATIAYFSGTAGGPDPMIHWFQRLGLSQDQVTMAVFATRKTVHFSFYALLAAACWRANPHPMRMKAVAFAVAFPIAHAMFDEARQRIAAGRAGSPWDVVLDGAGVLFALTVLGAFRSRSAAAA